MDREKLDEAIGGIRDEFVEEADARIAPIRRSRKKQIVAGITALAACAALVLTYSNFNGREKDDSKISYDSASFDAQAAKTEAASSSADGTENVGNTQENSAVYQTLSLTKGYKASADAAGAQVDDKFRDGMLEFSFNLFRENAATDTDHENALLSPASVMLALGMTENGASGNTLTQMEKVLGNLTNSEMNPYMHTLTARWSNDTCNTANSIWYRSDSFATLDVSKKFLQTNADFYSADAFAAPFDNTTLAAINQWVSDRTDGEITDTLDKIPNDAAMYLINTVVFEADWEFQYEKSDVQKRVFHAADGTTQSDVEYLIKSSEELFYLKDADTTGFSRPYKDDYSFIALLPNEGTSIDDYVQSLTAEKVKNLLDTKTKQSVTSCIPKFSYEDDSELKSALSAMGMKDAFAGEADFSRMTDDPLDKLLINNVFHKTFIRMTENGTKAGAVTVAEVGYGGADPEKAKTVDLNRPFVYMIYDNKTGLPVFIGTVYEI
ncbi:MAG: serpin family protein [Oscillospiraceae bacterium]